MNYVFLPHLAKCLNYICAQTVIFEMNHFVKQYSGFPLCQCLNWLSVLLKG